MCSPSLSRSPALAAWLAGLLLGATAHADRTAGPPSSAPFEDRAAADDAPPFPPAEVQGEAPQAPAEDGAEPRAGDAASPAPAGEPGADRPRYLQAPPELDPDDRAAAPDLPVPGEVQHARGFALVGAQMPLAVLWGGATAMAGGLALTTLLSAPALPLLPFGLAIALAPLLASAGGAVLSVAATLAVPPLVDLLFGHPAPPGTLSRLAFWSTIYAALIAVVAGVPITIPAVLAATGYTRGDGLGTLFGYAVAAALVPIVVAPLASLEAANEAGYRADLPQWCWFALQACSVGTYAVW